MESTKWYVGRYSQAWYASGGFDCKRQGYVTLELNPNGLFQLDYILTSFYSFPGSYKYVTTYRGKYKASGDTGSKVKIVLLVDQVEKEEDGTVKEQPSKYVASKTIEKFITEVVGDKISIKELPSIIGKDPVKPLEKVIPAPAAEWCVGDYKRECKTWNVQGGEDGGHVEAQLKPDQTFKVHVHWESNGGKEIKDYTYTGNYEVMVKWKNVTVAKLFAKEITSNGGEVKTEPATVLKVMVHTNRLQFYKLPSVFEKELLGPLSKKTNVFPWYIGDYRHKYNERGTSPLGGDSWGHRGLHLMPDKKFLMIDYDAIDDGGSDAWGSQDETSYYGGYEVLEDNGSKAKIKLVTTEIVIKDCGVLGEPDQKFASESTKTFEAIIDKTSAKLEGKADKRGNVILKRMDYYTSDKNQWYNRVYKKEYEREREAGLKSSVKVQFHVLEDDYCVVEIYDKCSDSEKGWSKYNRYDATIVIESMDDSCAQLKLVTKSVLKEVEGTKETKWQDPDALEKEAVILVRYNQAKFLKAFKGIEDPNMILNLAE